MGSLGSTARKVSFNSMVYPRGLDLTRSKVNGDDGTEVALAGALILQGQIVKKDANGFIIPGNGGSSVGVAKWGAVDLDYGIKVNMPLVLTGTTAVSTGFANISNVAVRNTADLSATARLASDYTVVAGAGTIARSGGSTITSGATVYVTFTYALTVAQARIDGNYFNSNTQSRTSFSENRITVIKAPSELYSAVYDTGGGLDNGGGLVSNEGQYATTGLQSRLFCGTDGLPYSPKLGSAPSADEVGYVLQVPTADDPWLGWWFQIIARVA